MNRRIYIDLPEEAVTCINRTVEALRAAGKTVTFDQVAATLLIAGSHIVVAEMTEERRNVRKPEPPEKKIGDMTASEFHRCLQARYDGQNVEAEREKMMNAIRASMAQVERLAQVSGPHMIDAKEWDNFKRQVEHQFSHCPSHRLALLVGWTDEHGVMAARPAADPGAN